MKCFNLKKKGLLLWLFLLPAISYAQIAITGTVVDRTGETVIGANVAVKGTAMGTVTDVDGKFSLTVTPDAVLVISCLGYKTQEVAVGNQTNIAVTLSEDVQALSEVVVVGYGTVKKSDLTGSVASVSAKQFKDHPVKNVADILQGRSAGVEVTTLSGMLGASAKVRIRGNTSVNKGNDPIYVIDGILNTSGLDGINPSDIQSIEVLKDASATAIYGSRGANGVVLVTTKSGVKGKSQIIFDAQTGLSFLGKTYDVMNAYEYALALNDIKGATTISEGDLKAYKYGYKGIDWLDLATQTGVSQDYKLSISGGNDKTRWLLSGNVLDQTAINIISKYQRLQLRANLDTEVFPWLAVSTKVNGSRTHAHNNGYDWMGTFVYSPTMELTNADGVYNMDPYNSAVSPSPYGSRMVNKNDDYSYNLNGNLNLLFKITDGLTLSVQGGTNVASTPSYAFVSKLTSPGTTNSMSNTSVISIYWQNTNNLTYQKTFGDHSLTATAVWEISSNEGRWQSITGQNLTNEIVGYDNIGNAVTRDGGNGYNAQTMASGIGRVFYSYLGRYLFTGTFRADGSSKFQGDRKWGYFPSGSVAWDIAKESFMADQQLFQQLKLRASAGVTGNQGIDPYSTLTSLQYYAYGWGTTTQLPGYYAGAFASSDVGWEKTTQYDIGADFSVWGGRVNFTFDWFLKNTTDLLFQKAIPDYHGGGSYWVNQGEVKNSGVEFSVNAFPVQGNTFSWETTFNAGYVKNEIVDLAGEEELLDAVFSDYGGAMQIMKPGYPLGSFYLYKWNRFDQEGANLYETSDGYLTNNATDQYITGQGNPAWTFGWNNTLVWKNWSANIFINAALGASRLNLVRYALASQSGTYRFINLREAYFNGWDKVENKAEALYPSHTNGDNKIYGNSDFWLENASFLKIRNISIAYQIPKAITKFVDISLSVSAQNVWTLTNYSGLDPEIYNSGQGIDFGAYPIPRTVTFGVKLTF